MAREPEKQRDEVGEARRPRQGMQSAGERGDVARYEPGGSPMWSSGPFGFMRRMMDEMDRMFDDLGFGGAGGGTPQLFGAGERAWAPRVDVKRRGDTMVVRADLPGVKQEDVEVEVEAGALTLRGERREEREHGEGEAHRRECVYGTFMRTIPLPEGADTENAKASFANGVLEITIPAPERRGRRIEIGKTPEGAGGATTH